MRNRDTIQYNNLFLHEFITESSLIDPQYSENRFLMPCEPGLLMYNNHMSAAKLMFELEKKYYGFQLCEDFIAEIHSRLTYNIIPFEGYRGRYRDFDIRVTNTKEELPSYKDLPRLMTLLDARISAILINKEAFPEYKQDYEKLAWSIHDHFECIHPFIDGNGRTGRILMNSIRVLGGLDPIIIYDKDKEKYYNKIREWRQNNRALFE